MKPRRTEFSTRVLGLQGGTEDNDLWITDTETESGYPVIYSVWEPTEAERKAIADGENIRVVVFATNTYPLNVDLTDEALGKPKDAEL